MKKPRKSARSALRWAARGCTQPERIHFCAESCRVCREKNERGRQTFEPAVPDRRTSVFYTPVTCE